MSAGAVEKVKRHLVVKLGRVRLVWIRGAVVQFGPWADKGYTCRGANVCRWWSFGRLYIEVFSW